jgi:hypothetical protein
MVDGVDSKGVGMTRLVVAAEDDDSEAVSWHGNR